MSKQATFTSGTINCFACSNDFDRDIAIMYADVERFVQ